jgi:molybdenum cofactor synthesis domain-containing protein
VLKLVEVLYAGTASTTRLKPGESMQIATGARLPRGANAVVMVEDTARAGERISIFHEVEDQEHVGRKGEDIMKGARVLAAGTVLDPGKIGVLASQGFRRATVYARPVVAVVPTGEEILPVGKRLQPGQIYDINSHTVAAVVRQNGGVVLTLPIVKDNLAALRAAFALALTADYVVTTGGSSVGERDLLLNVLQEMGRVLFHGIRIKPGKPVAFAMAQDKPVLGLPGNPTSCLIDAYLLLAPALRQMAHLPPARERVVKARLGRDERGSGDRRLFLTVWLKDGKAYSAFKESSAITSTADADGYISVPEDTPVLKKGTVVDVTLF